MSLCSGFPVGLHKCSLIWYSLKDGLAQNTSLHSGYLSSFCLSLISAGHTSHWIIFHCVGHCLLCLVSRLFSWLVAGACLPRHLVWFWGTFPNSYISSLTSVCLNCWCDNFEPWEVRIVRSSSEKIAFFVHSQVCVLIWQEFDMWSYLPRYCGQFLSFSVLITEIALCLCRMHACHCVYILIVFRHYGCHVTSESVLPSSLLCSVHIS